MKRPKTPLVDKVKDQIACYELALEGYSKADADARKDVREQFGAAYIAKHSSGCCPDTWIGDSLHEAITRKFRYVYTVVREEVARRSGVSESSLITVIEASWDDSTFAAILYDPWDFYHKKALCWFESTRAWHFCWDTAAEMEEALEDMVKEVLAALERAGARLSSSVGQVSD